MFAKTAIQTWLNRSIPCKQVVAGVGLMAVGQVMTAIAGQVQINAWKRYADDADQRAAILKEATDFLLDHTDEYVAVELNSRMDYWRTVRGIPSTNVIGENGHMGWCDGTCLLLTDGKYMCVDYTERHPNGEQ